VWGGNIRSVGRTNIGETGRNSKSSIFWDTTNATENA
jgi:hypothetical protein